MSSRLVASMLAASVMFGANGTLKEMFHADSHKVRLLGCMRENGRIGYLKTEFGLRTIPKMRHKIQSREEGMVSCLPQAGLG